MKNVLFDLHINSKSCILHGIQCKVFNTCHNMILNALSKCNSKLAQQKWVFSICFLDAAPGWVTWKIDAHASEVIGALCLGFQSNGVTNTAFKFNVPGGAACHGDWKCR